MTIRLYHDSPALEFEATVIAHDGDPSRVVLDRTAFYPTSGGQPHDTGLLGGLRVLDVIDADARIVHLLDGPLPLGPVDGRVDAERRFDYTVQHTAQHLVSAIAADRLGWETRSVHFGEESSTIEFATASASDRQLADLESRTNAAIMADHPVTTGREPSGAPGLRKPSTREGMLRIVTIAGLDRSACGGTHVTSTGRIGSVWVRGSERIRGHVRIVYLAGPRVLRVARSLDHALQELAAATGSSPEELPDLVPRRFEALRLATARVAALEGTVAAREAERLAHAVAPGPDGIRVVMELASDRSPTELQCLARAMAERPGTRFIGTIATPPLVVVAAHPASGWHAGTRLRAAMAAVGGKGGGAPTLAQGTVAAAADLAEVVATLLS
ncbi:MAG TPA: alanyl-tRNA editing protein [Gemmatimonadales bacterium]|nr:alanyl-tRNA editing protein [Gemmatimonadales bacterium]